MPADFPPLVRRRQTRPGINNSAAPAPQLITIAVGGQVTWSKHPLVVFWSAHPGLQQKIDQVTRRAGARRSQTAQDCTGSFLAFRRQRRRPSPDPIPECRLFSVPDVIRPNLVRAIGPVPCRRSAQAALWSAKKLSGGSASDAVNRGSKRNRVAQYGQRIVSAWPILI